MTTIAVAVATRAPGGHFVALVAGEDRKLEQRRHCHARLDPAPTPRPVSAAIAKRR